MLPFHSGAFGPRLMRISERSWLWHVPGWLSAGDLMNRLLDELPLRQEHITMYGVQRAQPRLTAVAGRSMSPASRYRRPNPETPWTPAAALVRDLVSEAVAECTGGWEPNGLIANLYRDRSLDSISWHADDEPALGRDPVVVSVSFGAPRTFLLRRGDKGTAEHSVVLDHGDLLVMGGRTQSEFKHAIHKRQSAGARLSLTFRRYL